MMTQLKSGTILRDRYTITSLIGAGGMGAVYLADDQRISGRRCAVKEQLVYDKTLATQVQQQFEQEASILAQLDHPGLPKVSDFFSNDANDRDYLVMDYVPGQNLAQLVKQARADNEFLDEGIVLNWVDQICDILTYLHNCSPIVLHRDIKPANIKLMPDHRLKLVDFGLAKPFDPTDPRTVTGLQGLGSLPYTPIEQYVGHMGHTDVRSDLYALGATCYHLLTGQAPVSAHDYFLNPNSLIPPRQINTNLSTHVNDIVLWAMQLHPDSRAASIIEWHQMLFQDTEMGETGLGSISLALQATATRSSVPQILRENGILLVVSVLLLMLALVMTFGG
ncbi:MAG: serine/threonine-protein kinase [Chloroflexota bacterium]